MPLKTMEGQPEMKVRVEFKGTRAEIALSNGPLNLVTRALLRDLDRALGEVNSQADIRCLIVHGGSARAFCAGSDIKEFGELREDASERKILYEDMVLRKLARMPMPTIAAIDGPALGGGLELALACDLRVARAEATLGLPESRLGGLAGNGAVRLTRLTGPAIAKEMLFTGAILEGERALECGLVNWIAREGSALELARIHAETIAERGPLSNRFAKQLVDAALDGAMDAGLSMSTVLQQKIFDSEDLYEGMASFFDKRSPIFVGK